MKDPCSPTLAEIRDWAYGDEAYPVDDWDIIVFSDITDDELTALVLRIASDDDCRNQNAFVHFLDVMTGTVIRFTNAEENDRRELAKLRKLIAHGEKSTSAPVQDWAKRARHLVHSPHTFRYEDWF